MRPSEVLRRASRYLEAHDVESPRETAEVLLQHVLATDRASLYARTEGLTSAEARAFGRALCRRCTGAPVQHVTGRQAFRSLELEVRPGVFVPRPETEVLVDVGLELVGRIERPVVVDVGTGTGAVALSIKRACPAARVFATDLASEAVELAGVNAAALGLDVEILRGDLLSVLPADVANGVDLVVSNPPYVGVEEFDALPPEVRADPELALLGGTALHGRLVTESPLWLRQGGALAVEIGAGQGPEAAALFRDGGFLDVRVLPDLSRRDRIVAGRV
ncbi:MAG: peptide chain release factor N(5)-glutamine methyltransferase [Actinomycetota bacterium]